MSDYSIEQDYLGEFFDPINYDLEVGGDHPSHHFYAELAKQVGGNVLEVACGTGLVTIPLAQQGILITGLDIVPAMLAHAKFKSEHLGLSIRWLQGDARNFDLNETFNFIYMTGNAFQAFLNNSDQGALLLNIRKHLKPSGVFAFETRNPNWVDLTYDPNETEWMTYTNDKGCQVRITETREYDWAFSAATRTTQLVPIAFMVVLTWLYIAWNYRASLLPPILARSTLALAGPLAICGGILAWYNWARFDSIFEFGLYYQLAAFNLQANYDILFSRIYLLQNLYNYFLNPFELTGDFPFFNALPGSEKPVLSSFELPNLYAVEGRFGGALVSTPFLLFSWIPVIQGVLTFTKKLRGSAGREDHFDVFDWTVLGLAGSAVAGALPTLLLFYVGFRYETEFIACLTLLSLIGFSQGYQILKNRRARKVVTVLGISLAVFSILANLALSYSGMRG